MPWRKVLKVVNPTDLITLAYIFITGLFIVTCSFKLTGFSTHLLIRFSFILIISSLIYLDNRYQNRIISFLRNFYPLALLGYFYPEIDFLNNVFFRNMDPEVANLEVTIFGGHPSVWFSEIFHWKWFNDLMNLGYLSYYFVIFILAFWVYHKNYKSYPYVIFIISMSFYIYYIIFIIFPVAGPQFYLPPPDNSIPDAYIFREIMKLIHGMGEKPAAAFPSSHVGVMIILLYLSTKFAKKLLKWYIPIGILLILSTVYIKAHYVIDVIAGFLSAPIIYWICSQTYTAITTGLHQEHQLQAFHESLKRLIIKAIDKFRKKD